MVSPFPQTTWLFDLATPAQGWVKAKLAIICGANVACDLRRFALR